MPREAYTKTTWVDKSTPVNALNLNKIENAIKQVDSETLDLITRVEGLEATSGSGSGAEDLVKLKEDVAKLKEDVTAKAASDHTHSEFTTYNEHENRIKAIENLNLATALQNITDRLTALESAMQNHTHETLAGTTSAGTTEQSR